MDYTYDLIGTINDDSVTKVMNSIKAKNDIDSLTIRINSGGGSVSSAVALYNFLKSQSFNIYTHNYADVSSAAIIIYLAGEKRTSEDISKFLIHPLTFNLQGTYAFPKVEELFNSISQDIENYSKIVNKETNNLNGLYDIYQGLKSQAITLDKNKAIQCNIVTNP